MWKLNEILVRVTGKSSFVGQSGRVKSSQGRVHQLGSIEGRRTEYKKAASHRWALVSLVPQEMAFASGRKASQYFASCKQVGRQ